MFFFLFYSCSTTKFVPEKQYLLNKVKVKIKQNDVRINKTNIVKQIQQRENQKILGFWKFHLGLYDLSSKNKENCWLKRVGEPPVIFKKNAVERSEKQIKLYLENKGYYGSVVTNRILYLKRKPKVNIYYNIELGMSYHIKNCIYHSRDKSILPLLSSDSLNRYLKKGKIFDIDLLKKERERLVTVMNNHGYYLFTEDNIKFLADSTVNNYQVNLSVEISDGAYNKYAEIHPHKKFKVDKYFIHTDYSDLFFRLKNGTMDEIDTLNRFPYVYIYRDKMPYRAEMIRSLNRIPDSLYYSLANVRKTYRSLNQLQQFKVVNLNFDIEDSLKTDSVGMLNCNFQLRPLERQGFSVDLEGTNSSGNMGVAGNFNYQHRNLFRGAEILDVTFKTAFEREQTVVNENSSNFNTREFGVEASLTVPKFLSPVYKKSFFSYQVPKTSFTMGYNYQKRPDYTRTITNFKFGYDWKSSAFRTHRLSLVDINYVNLSAFDEDFLNSIEDLYIKSSYTDHLIFDMNYSMINNTQDLNKRGNYKYFKWSFESAGNLLDGLSVIFNRNKTLGTDTITDQPIDYYEIFGTRFSQYLKADFEYRYGYVLNDYSSVVGRAFFGIGLPYSNNKTLPFEKKYFTGGANGIRAWQVRTLGPGSYNSSDSEYPNQSADMKIEGNLEYRFNLIKQLEGAFFVDAGNIWAVRDDNRDGSEFNIMNFYKQIAIGTGVGLRFDFTYFVFRLDLGMKVRDPAFDPGDRFIIGNHSLNSDQFNLSFAIGYPF